jgi:predicted DNA-binding ribbon-helix-helix protein
MSCTDKSSFDKKLTSNKMGMTAKSWNISMATDFSPYGVTISLDFLRYVKTIAVDDRLNASDITIAEVASIENRKCAIRNIVSALKVTCNKPLKSMASFIFFSFENDISKPMVNIKKTIPNSPIRSNDFKSSLWLKPKILLMSVPVIMYPII